MSTFFDFMLLVLGFSLVIFVHELGHFAVAKWVGIKVEQFAIGMGPALVAWRKGVGFRARTTLPDYEKALRDPMLANRVGETEYRINYLPIGGYVKMLGQEDLDMAAVVSDPRSYSSRPIWARMCVVSAGVVMNLIFAMVLFVICFMWGVKVPMPIIGGVQADSLAAITMPNNAADHGVTTPGILPGDRIVAINGREIRTWEQVILSAAIAKPNETLHVEVDRRGTLLTFDLEPRPDRDTQLLALGVASTQSNRIIAFEPGSAAEQFVKDAFNRAGLEEVQIAPGMRLTRIDGESVEAVWQLSRAIDESEGRILTLTFEDAESGAVQDAMLRPDPDFMLAQMEHDSTWYAVRHVLGLVPAPVVAVVDTSREDWLAPGDLIRSVGDVQWPRTDELLVALQPRSSASLTVLRGEETIGFDVSVRRNGSAGFGPSDMPALTPPIVADVLRTVPVNSPRDAETTTAVSPAAALNLMSGTRLLSIDGEPVRNWREVFLALRDALDPDAERTTIALTYELPIPNRPVESVDWTIEQPFAQALLALQWHSQLAVDVFQPMQEIQKAANPIVAIQMGMERTWEMIVTTYQTLDRLVRGTVKVDQLKGPVGIAELGTRVAGQGLPYLLLFLGIINVNLAVLNFLPIPIVDGGLMVFLIIEKLKGSPVSVQVQNAATVVGLLLIGSLFLVTFYNDVLNLIGNFAS